MIDARAVRASGRRMLAQLREDIQGCFTRHDLLSIGGETTASASLALVLLRDAGLIELIGRRYSLSDLGRGTTAYPLLVGALATVTPEQLAKAAAPRRRYAVTSQQSATVRLDVTDPGPLAPGDYLVQVISAEEHEGRLLIMLGTVPAMP